MEKFSFFNDVNDDRVYYAEDWARHLKKYFTNGIFNNELNVVSNNDMTITIKEGDANIEGYRYTNTGDLVKTIDNADGTLNRIDNVVLRLDLTNRLISAQIIKGTFADKPVAPELVRTSTIYDLRIAKISIPAGTTTITQDLITDTRFITSDCGNVISTVQTPDTENLFIQMQTLFEKQINELNNNFEIWFDSIKNQLDSDAAGNLQNQINNLNSNKVDNATYDPNSKNLQLTSNGKIVGDSVHIPTGITDEVSGEEDLKIINNKGVVKFSLEGKSTQKTRSGKNKFCLNKLNWITTSTSPILTINSDNSCVISKTNPVAYDVIRADITNFLEVGKTYIASANVSNKDYGQFVFDEYNGSTRVQSGKNKIKIIDGYTYYIKIYVNRTSSAYDGDLSITYTDMQIEEGITETSFEKYGASPSPDYPSEIISIPSVENLFDKDSVELGKVWNGSINTKRAYGYIEVIQGQEYTVSTKNTNSDLKIYIIESTSIGAIETPIVQNELKSTLTFTPKTTTKYIVVQFSTTTNDMIQTIVDNALVKIEKGTIAHPYVPFGNYLRIDNVGKNLFDKDNAIKGFYYDALGGLSPSENWYYENIRVKPNTSYSISGNTTNNTSAFFVELNKNLELVKIIGNYYNTHNFTTSNETYYVGVSISWYGDSDGRNNINTFQVEKGSATEYEPYRNKVIYVNMQDKKLCSNKDETIKDKLIIYDNGKTEINKKIGEVILTGNENIVSDGKTSNYYRYKIGINLGTFLNYPTTLCTHFIYNLSYTADAPHFYILKTGEMLFFSDKSTLDEFKNWLKVQYDAGTPVIIQYELAEPEVVDLGKVDFELLEGNSTLNLEEDLKSNMSIKYYTDSTVVDLKKKVENKQNVILHGTTVPSNDLGEDGDIYLQHN